MSNRLEDFRIRQAIGSGCPKRCSRSLPVGRFDCESELENGLDLRIGRSSFSGIGAILGADPSRARSASMCGEAIIAAVSGCLAIAICSCAEAERTPSRRKPLLPV